MTDDHYQEPKTLTRRRMRLVWEEAQLGASFEGEDARLVEAMREHPDAVRADLWGRLDELTDEQIEQDGTHPILHVLIHQTIENQIAGGEPAIMGQAVEALTQRGLSRHEAIHQVGAVLIEEIWPAITKNRPFNEPRMARRLRRLVRKKATRG